jgi:hypothetical protein
MGLKVILHVIDSLFIGHSGFGVERSKDVGGLGILLPVDVLEVGPLQSLQSNASVEGWWKKSDKSE